MTAADDLITTNLLAFAMKAHSQLRPGQPLQPLPYVRILTSRLERVSSGDCKRLVVALPPRHAKTFLCSICLSAWLLAHAPASKILVVSYGQELADKIAYDIREILRSDWFRRLFKTRIAKGKLTPTSSPLPAAACARSQLKVASPGLVLTSSSSTIRCRSKIARIPGRSSASTTFSTAKSEHVLTIRKRARS
jgi:hypothetical protein